MEKEQIDKIVDIVNDFKNHSNKDLILALETLNKEFETTKETVIKLTYYLDNLENTYNSILKEYRQRDGKFDLVYYANNAEYAVCLSK